jgi:tetratricopeptide (TPR) repeat protein
MHELLRQFAAEKLEIGDWRPVPVQGLETGDLALEAQSEIRNAVLSLSKDPKSEIRSRHSRFYLAFVGDRATLLHGRESQKVVAEIQQEVDNVRQAWQWAVTHAEIEAIDHSLDGLSRYYLLAGPLQEGETAFSMAADRMRALVEEETCSGAGSRDVQVILGKLLTEQARFLNEQARCHQAIATAQAAIRLAQTTQAVRPEAVGHLLWGRALWRQGDYEAAQPRLEQALALARAAQRRPETCPEPRRRACPEVWSGPGLGEGAVEELRQVEGGSLRNLGIVSFYLGDYAGARRYYEQALRIYREIGDRRGESAALNNLGVVSRHQGDCLGARAYYEQVLRIKREIGDRQGEAITLNNLGTACLYLGDYPGARAYYEQALHIKREIGDRRGEGVGLSNLSLLFHHLGDDEAAREYSLHALDIAREMSDRARQGSALTLLGHALAGLGRLAEAADAYRQALDLRRELGQPNLAMEDLAGLARVAQGQALARVEEILD